MRKILFCGFLLITYMLLNVSCSDVIQDPNANNAGTKAATAQEYDRIMSYNIRHCQGVDNVLNYDRTAKVITLMSPDIVCLQEVDSVTARSNRTDQAKLLGQKTGMNAYFGAAMPHDGGKYGNAILSKEKAIRTRTVPLPGQEVRCALIVEFDKYVVISVHLTHLSSEESLRVQSVRTLTTIAKTYDKPVYMAGDMNQKHSTTASLFVEFAKNWDIVSAIKNTASTTNPTQCIDFIFALKGEGTQKIASDVITSLSGVNVPQTSDHFPLYSDLRKVQYPSQYPKASGNLRIATQYTRFCQGTDGVIDYDLMANVYNKMEADIICVQGVDSVTTRSNRLYQLAELGKRTKMKYAFSAAIAHQGGKYGVGILTKEAPLKEYRKALPGNEARTAMVAEYSKYVVMSTHLDGNQAKRIESIQQLTTYAKTFYKPVFLAGYFSEDDGGLLFQEIRKNWTVVSTDEPSFPSSNPTRHLGFIVSLNDYLIQPVQSQVVNYIKGGRVHITSDHLPVFCDFAPIPFTVEIPKASGSKRIVSQYLKYCIGTDGKIDYDRLAAVYTRADADVVCVQGIDSMTTRSVNQYQLGQIGNRSGLKPYFSAAITHQGGKYGVGILSKETPVRQHRLALPGNEARTAMIVEYSNYVVMTTQLDGNQAKRIESARLLTSFARTFDKTVLLTGFINEDQTGQLLTSEMAADWTVISANKATYPSTNPTRILNFVMRLNNNHSPAVTGSNAIGSMNGVNVPVTSEHLPIYCDLRF